MVLHVADGSAVRRGGVGGGGVTVSHHSFCLMQASEVTRTDDSHAHMKYDYVSFRFFPKHAELEKN